MKDKDAIPVARIGKTVGLRGDLRLNLMTDFPEQFRKGAVFMTDRGELTVASYNPAKGTVRFVGFDDVDRAKPLTNLYLYTTKEATVRDCRLEEGEYFWFQIIGLNVEENGALLGRIERIERMAGTDYLVVKTEGSLVLQGAPKSFLIPYIERYVKEVSLEKGTVRTDGARDILEAS